MTWEEYEAKRHLAKEVAEAKAKLDWAIHEHAEGRISFNVFYGIKEYYIMMKMRQSNEEMSNAMRPLREAKRPVFKHFWEFWK